MGLTPHAWSIHSVMPRSRSNGPGTRYVIWVQGCSIGCPGCFNPGTHPLRDPEYQVPDVLEDVLETREIEGVTVTGGEPLDQPGPLREFCRGIRRRSDLGIIVFSGFSRSRIMSDPRRAAAVSAADMVIAGPYVRRLHVGRGLRGSSNQAYWALTDRYAAEDFEDLPVMEIVVGTDGLVTVTGMTTVSEGEQ